MGMDMGIGTQCRLYWKVLKIEQLECVSYDIVCGVFYCVDNEKARINANDCHERKLRVGLRRLVIEMRLGHFQTVFFSLLNYARCSNCFMHFMRLFIICPI